MAAYCCYFQGLLGKNKNKCPNKQKSTQLVFFILIIFSKRTTGKQHEFYTWSHIFMIRGCDNTIFEFGKISVNLLILD